MAEEATYAEEDMTFMRGVQEIAPVTRTDSWRRNYEANPALRGEFLSICEMKRG